jgi:hypothetical protein
MTDFIADQAALARARGQGRHIPATRKQANQYEAGSALADTDFPGYVKTGDELIGRDRYWRAGYDSRVCQLRELNTAAGREPHQWVHPGVTDLEITQLAANSATGRNRAVAALCRSALEGDAAARERVTAIILRSRRVLARLYA